MSISDRLDEIEATLGYPPDPDMDAPGLYDTWVRHARALDDDRHNAVAALRAVLDLCDEASDPPTVAGFDVGMAAMAQQVRRAITAALGEERDVSDVLAMPPLRGTHARPPHAGPPMLGGSMTAVYRAYSLSRDDYHGLTDDEDAMRGIVGALNQGAACGLYPPDWTIQTGHITWKEAP